MRHPILYASVLNIFVQHAAMASEKPNIVFILIDDMGWKDISCMGSQSKSDMIRN